MSLFTATPMIDTFQRPIDYLRVSVTDRCNLKCRYCAPAAPCRVPKSQALSLEELHRLVRIAVHLGIRKVRITGGEPLVRQNIVEFIAHLRDIRGLEDLALTTNGTLLTQYGKALQQAGLTRLNISLDTLNPQTFRRITGLDLFARVWQGIMTALDLGFAPVKLNVVVMQGYNDHEIEALADLSQRWPLHVRFIEYMPIAAQPQLSQQYFLSAADIRTRLEAMGTLIPVASARGGGPAQRFRFPQAPGEIGLISSMSCHFCRSCNRLRLTATGHLRPCLLADNQVNIMGAMRAGADDEALADIFRQVVAEKKREHHLTFGTGYSVQTGMGSIGG